MKSKFNFGLMLALALSLLTFFIWLVVRDYTPTFSSYGIATHSLGQLFGLIGMVLFSLSFVLMTRSKFLERLSGGLDRMYSQHHLIGIFAFILILFHPLLLVLKFVPSNVAQAANYLLPSGAWSVNFGIIALVLMILLIVFTMFMALKYQRWKLSHKFMGAVYLFTLLHIFLITTDISRYPALKIYIIIISILGGLAYIYGLFIRPYFGGYKYGIVKIELRDKITLLEMKPIGKKMKFNAGQFAFVQMDKSELGNEQHPFSILSSPEKENITFGIKSLGDYTSHLELLKIGTRVRLEGPYGGFFNLNSKKDKIIVAGGIGITPFLSVLGSLRFSEKVDLYYCTGTKKEMVFLKELNKIAEKNKNIKIIEWNSDEKGRINFQGISKAGVDIPKKDILLCGPPAMMKSLAFEFKKNQIKEKDIYFENFNIK